MTDFFLYSELSLNIQILEQQLVDSLNQLHEKKQSKNCSENHRAENKTDGRPEFSVKYYKMAMMTYG